MTEPANPAPPFRPRLEPAHQDLELARRRWQGLPEDLELIEGKPYFRDEDRIYLLSWLLEVVGLRRAVRIGDDLGEWERAVAERRRELAGAETQGYPSLWHAIDRPDADERLAEAERARRELGVGPSQEGRGPDSELGWRGSEIPPGLSEREDEGVAPPVGPPDDAQRLRNEIEAARRELEVYDEPCVMRQGWQEHLDWLVRLAARLGVEVPVDDQAQLRALATQVLGSAAAAGEWLWSPHPLLGERTPLAVARDPEGAGQVRQILERLEHSLPT